MRNLNNPRQKYLFNPYQSVFSESHFRELDSGWQGVFRHVILELLPAQEIAEYFDKKMGRPTKELYSIAGLIFLAEAMDWTREEALSAYKYRMDVHYALNLSAGAHEIGMRTFERYLAIFEQDDLAAEVMSTVTLRLVELLELDVKKQRLDSTHIFSNMASMGRTRLMRTVIKRFLRQVKRHDIGGYNALPEELRERYAQSDNKVFGYAKDDEKQMRIVRHQTAKDLYDIIEFFAKDSSHTNRSTYKEMVLVFNQQCEVTKEEDRELVEVRKKTGGDVIINPSDPDATYDGHKGDGYQVQISETCGEENDVQLIVDAVVQTAVTSDSCSLEGVLENLEALDLSPKQLLADTSYCSDENVQKASAQGVELIGPAPGKYRTERRKMNLADFVIDEESLIITRCPAGKAPIYTEQYRKSGRCHGEPDTLLTVMNGNVCSKCELKNQCPGMFSGGPMSKFTFRIHFPLKSLRLLIRREVEQTEQFKNLYKKRSGIEATNSGLKQKTGMGRLRVRGKKESPWQPS